MGTLRRGASVGVNPLAANEGVVSWTATEAAGATTGALIGALDADALGCDDFAASAGALPIPTLTPKSTLTTSRTPDSG